MSKMSHYEMLRQVVVRFHESSTTEELMEILLEIPECVESIKETVDLVDENLQQMASDAQE